MAGIAGCGSTARKNKMNAQFRAMKRDVKVVERTPEPEAKMNLDGEALRVLAEQGFDADKAVEEAEKKGLVKEPTTAVAKLVEQKEKKEGSTARAARGGPDPSAALKASILAPAGVCLPLHPALKRLQSDRMKHTTLDANPDKYVGQVERSYKDMGGVEMTDYRIEPGDTLASISMKTFGTTRRWPELWLLNIDEIKVFDILYAGRVIKVPKVDFAKHCEPTSNITPEQSSGQN